MLCFEDEDCFWNFEESQNVFFEDINFHGVDFDEARQECKDVRYDGLLVYTHGSRKPIFHYVN